MTKLCNILEESMLSFKSDSVTRDSLTSGKLGDRVEEYLSIQSQKRKRMILKARYSFPHVSQFPRVLESIYWYSYPTVSRAERAYRCFPVPSRNCVDFDFPRW